MRRYLIKITLLDSVALCKSMKGKFKPLLFMLRDVGEVRKKVLIESPDGRNLEVLHAPLMNDPSHSGIYNLKQDDELIAELILETICESYSARK